jgi:hypothetical protein
MPIGTAAPAAAEKIVRLKQVCGGMAQRWDRNEHSARHRGGRGAAMRSQPTFPAPFHCCRSPKRARYLWSSFEATPPTSQNFQESRKSAARFESVRKAGLEVGPRTIGNGFGQHAGL